MTNPRTPAGGAPSGGGMPKWLIILLVVLLVIIIGCCGGVTTCFYFVRKAAKAAPGFVQEQMKAQGVEVNLPNASGVTPMPSNFPSDVPVYQGMKVTESTANLKENSCDVVFSTSASAADVKAYYDEQMPQNGWKQDSTSQTGDVSSSVYSKDTGTAIVSITGGTPTSVSISYGKK